MGGASPKDHAPEAILGGLNTMATGIVGLLRPHALMHSYTDAVMSSNGQGTFHQAILGDLNTMGHGIARLSAHHCTDALRLRSLGSYEAEVWQATVLRQADPLYATDPPQSADHPPMQLPSQHSREAHSLEDRAAQQAEHSVPANPAPVQQHSLGTASRGGREPLAGACSGDSRLEAAGEQPPTLLAGGRSAEGHLGRSADEGRAASRRRAAGAGMQHNRQLRRWGLSETVCQDVLNPGKSCYVCFLL